MDSYICIPFICQQRLRTENRLLRQRIEILEKENEQLADKLIQGQLARAQEAEDNYTTKRELENVKQSDIEKAKQLESAQTTIQDLREKVCVYQVSWT